MNLRPSGYEPDELPDCSTPRREGDFISTVARATRSLAHKKDCGRSLFQRQTSLLHKPEGIFKGPGSARVIHGSALDPGKNLCMGYNFLPVERDQLYLMPPSVTDWLPQDHLAFFVLDAVEQMDLSAFYADYRQDGWGAAAHEPAMMVGLLVYAYCVGVRSSRQVERACHLDVAFRVIAANQTPDHTTISRFSARHEKALSSAFCESLRLCAKAGMAKVGIVAVDGTKMAADASRVANRTSAHIEAEVAKILAEAAAIDAAEDAQFGPDARGDEPPATLPRTARTAASASPRRRHSWMPSVPRPRPHTSPISPGGRLSRPRGASSCEEESRSKSPASTP